MVFIETFKITCNKATITFNIKKPATRLRINRLIYTTGSVSNHFFPYHIRWLDPFKFI